MTDCTIITYKDVKIVYTDVSETAGDGVIPCFEKYQKVAQEFADGTILSLVNAKDARYNSSLISTIKKR